ncbi:MAG: protein kinase [Myxococcales bacterium]|nr:protein kinase [Myxococcales bacterium]
MNIPRSLCEGRYSVKQVLGRSERSIVYECYDIQTETRVAVKVLSVGGPNPEIARAMYRREVGALRGFEHPFVVQMQHYQPEEEAGRLNIVLELIPGGKTLEDLIRAGDPTLDPLARTMRWRLEQALGLLGVLVTAHQRNIVHRDVKPRNILVDRDQQQLRLVDFGIARILENYGRGAAGETLRDFYTRPYAAPEQVLRQDTSFPADFHAFGVVLAAMLAWRLPEADFNAEKLPDLLAEVDPEHRAVLDHLTPLVQQLLAADAGRRPGAAEVERALRVALDAVVEREVVRVVLTSTARRKAQDCGLSGPLLDDLNHGLRIFYEPEIEHKKWSIVCLGRLGRARLAADADQPEKLKLVDYYLPHPPDHARQREQASSAPFLLVEGDGPGIGLIEFAYEEFQRGQARHAEQGEIDALLDVANYILEQQRERLGAIRVRYALAEPDGEPAAKTRHVTDEFLVLTVLAAELPAPGEQPAHVAADLDRLDEHLTPDSCFTLGGKELGAAHSYEPERRALTLRLRRAATIPVQGDLVCEDLAQRTALDRQDKAIDTFEAGRAVNARLARLLLHPEKNTLDERAPVELLQPLSPPLEVADMVSRCLAAKDIFMVQGPPGTGKTTFITEVMMQLLRRDPQARILLASQGNEAVQNAVDALRAEDIRLGSRWRIVRDRSSLRSRNAPAVGFDYDFAEWARRTIERCTEAAHALPTGLASTRRKQLEDILANWRQKLAKVPDAKQDYAESVQVWAMTLLRVPTLWKRMRDVRFDYVIIDEAARATTSELLVAMIAGERFILVGDHRQLPPFLATETRSDLIRAGHDPERAARSLFEDLFERINPDNRTTLRRQFRMHRSIGAVIGELYYPEVGLETGVADAERTLALPAFDGPSRIFWVDIVEGRERRSDASKSRWNFEEVDAIEALLVGWEQELAARGGAYTIGVIAAYADQREKLVDRVRPGGKRWRALTIRIDTVHAFQGKQDDIILYSLVRANTQDLRFVGDPRLLNVAFSRAKRLLVVVGHRDTAMQDRELAAFIRKIPDANILSPRRKS